MISYCVIARSERPGLQSGIVVLILLMAVNLIPAVAIAQKPPAQSCGVGEGMAQNDEAISGASKVQVSGLDNARGAEGAPCTPAGEQQSNAASPSTTGNRTGSDQAAKKEEKNEKRGAIVAAPLPISSPAIGTGIIPFAGYIFHIDKTDKITPPSVVGGVGLITNNGSRALALGGELYLKR